MGKEFDLKRALAGEPVVLKGTTTPVTQLTVFELTDSVPEKSRQVLMGVVNGAGGASLRQFFTTDCSWALEMAPKKRKVWILAWLNCGGRAMGGVYTQHCFSQEAADNAKATYHPHKLILETVVEIEVAE